MRYLFLPWVFHIFFWLSLQTKVGPLLWKAIYNTLVSVQHLPWKKTSLSIGPNFVVVVVVVVVVIFCVCHFNACCGSPVDCARHGWLCAGAETLRCLDCGTELKLAVGVPSKCCVLEPKPFASFTDLWVCAFSCFFFKKYRTYSSFF